METLCLELQIPIFEAREAQPVSRPLRLKTLNVTLSATTELDDGNKWRLSSGGERHQHAPAGEEHPHSGGGPAEGEGSPDAATQASAGAGPRSVRHPVLHAVRHLARLRSFAGGAGQLQTARRQPERREGGRLAQTVLPPQSSNGPI